MKLGVENTRLIAIGDAIRTKRGTQGLYSLAEMPDEILAIETEAVIEQKNISANGTYTAPSGVDGFSPVVVNVPNSYGASDEGKVVDDGALVAQTSRTIDENGTYDTTLNNEVVVDVEGGSATLIPKTITENGTYNPADDNADGYEEVTVEVSGGGDAILKTVKIWTHSTGGQDASLYAQEFTWDGETLTAVGSPMDISFWSFYNHEIEYLDLFDAVRLSYTSPNWAISAITDVVYNGTAVSAGNQIAYWHYSTNTTCFIICDVEGGEPKNILSGTDAPTASLGSDGDIYLQYIHIPSGVTPLEYIQSTGTQYIDTDVLATSDIAVEVEFFDYEFSGDSLLFGYRPNSWNGGLGVNNNGNSKMYLYYGGSNNGGIIPPMESGIVKLENGIRTINGYEAYFTPTTFSYSYQIFIFATNNNGTASYFSKYKIKSLKMWEDGTLIRHFIPAKDTDDIACLYDLINDDFYYDGGGGTFLEGNEINDDYIINSYCKVNGTWQALEGTDVDDVNTEGGGEPQPIDYSYLPNSDADNVLASADDAMMNDFSIGTLSVAIGSLTASRNKLVKDENGVALPYGVVLYCPLTAPNTDVTAYFVGKNYSSVSRESFFLNVAYAHSSGNAVTFYSSNGTAIQMTVYGSYNPQITGESNKDYHVYAISLNQTTKKAKFYFDGEFKEEITFTNSGNCVSFSGSLVTSSYNDDYYFKYGGVVEECESDATIIANMQTIATKLGLTI